MLYRSVLAASFASAVLGAGIQLPTLAQDIINAAITVTSGDYIFQNVATNQTLKYMRESNGQELFPQDGQGSPITIQTMGDYSVISPAESNNKCMSAQWDYDIVPKRNWAGALYACRVFSFQKRSAAHRRALEPRVALRLAKQYWYLLATDDDDVYKVIAVDHLSDMPATALGSQMVNARNGGMRYPELAVIDNDDDNQLWRITPSN